MDALYSFPPWQMERLMLFLKTSYIRALWNITLIYFYIRKSICPYFISVTSVPAYYLAKAYTFPNYMLP